MNDADLELFRSLLAYQIADVQRQIDKLELRDQRAPDANRARRIAELLAQLDQLTDNLDRVASEGA